MKAKKTNKIELVGCILDIKGNKITLTPTELYQLKMELEKVYPTPPMIIKEPVYIPSQPSTPMWPTPHIPWVTNDRIEVTYGHPKIIS